MTVPPLAQKARDCVSCGYCCSMWNQCHDVRWKFSGLGLFLCCWFFLTQAMRYSVKQMLLWLQNQQLKLEKAKIKDACFKMCVYTYILPLIIWSHHIFSSVGLLCLSNLWIHVCMHTCMRVCMCQKEKCNLLCCLDKAHKVSSNKRWKKRFSLTQTMPLATSSLFLSFLFHLQTFISGLHL